jgi:DNA polymerase-4
MKVVQKSARFGQTVSRTAAGVPEHDVDRAAPRQTVQVRGAADWILHVDLDQFLAAVEVLRRPELAGRPVVVGGDGNPNRPRQVVATASYEARAFGIRSGMPLAAAARRCPDAVFLPSDRPAYEAASARVMTALRSLPVVVEVWGWDEAFVGATTDDPEALAHTIKATVLASTGLTCAVGIGETKLQAKTATGFAKPGGIARLTRRTWFETMGTRPVTAIWGIGPRTADHLAEMGIHTVVDLATCDHQELARRFGPRIGPSLKVLGLGGDDAGVVDEPYVPRGRSREVTFERDLTSRAEIEEHVTRLAIEVTESVVAEGRRVTHVAVKIRTPSFFTRTKIGKLVRATTDATDVVRHALVVLDRFDLDRPVRLLGVRVVLDVPAPTAANDESEEITG